MNHSGRRLDGQTKRGEGPELLLEQPEAHAPHSVTWVAVTPGCNRLKSAFARSCATLQKTPLTWKGRSHLYQRSQSDESNQESSATDPKMGIRA